MTFDPGRFWPNPVLVEMLRAWEASPWAGWVFEPTPPPLPWLPPDGRDWLSRRGLPPLTVIVSTSTNISPVPHAAWLACLPPARFRRRPPVFRSLTAPRVALLP